jgi:hypothetical protein
MRRPSRSLNRLLAITAAAAVAVGGIAAVSLAAGGADSSRVKVKLRCPKTIKQGKVVKCRLFGGVLRGPVGPRGAKGAKGAKGQRGARGPTGPAGVSGYQVVSQTFNDVSVPKSEGGRGLSSVQTVVCPSNKRVVGGGTDLGSDEAQAAAQRQVAVSLSGPNSAGTGWSAQLFNISTTEDQTIDLRIFAICARA